MKKSPPFARGDFLTGAKISRDTGTPDWKGTSNIISSRPYNYIIIYIIFVFLGVVVAIILLLLLLVVVVVVVIVVIIVVM